ncbi:hypothetical protein F6B41_33045 [Microbacterium lushaniae]|nr:hypothetical protein F6B41_33045 [Microbacterium lushaniae]
MPQSKLTSAHDVWSLGLMMATLVTDKDFEMLAPDRMAFLSGQLTTGKLVWHERLLVQHLPATLATPLLQQFFFDWVTMDF